ncbi:MAG: OmpH family outer membrane protein [Sedimentisphaerales bacterium]|jgi:Skp family chaperone for outer membrane proteins|nr:OmpH family outer membrane protein [Sedimentisphaerales bacterium]
MKIKTLVVIVFLAAIVLLVGYEVGLGESEGDSSELKVGIVSMRRVLQECKRSAKYRQEALAERDRVLAELERLQAEIGADQAALKTRKVGSNDYMALLKEMLDKQASLQAQQKFYEQQVGVREQTMIEGLYKDILKVVGEVAEEKGLALVFEKSEPELPAVSASDLMRTIDTNKLLYSGGGLDISDEVIARLDAGE